MKCQNCAREISESNKFCPFCGSPQNRPAAPVPQPAPAARCPGCGGEVKAGQAFCMNCGTGLTVTQTASPSVSPPQPKTPPPIVPAGPRPTGGSAPMQQIASAARCPGCGGEMKAGQAFCMNCGTRMPVMGTSAPPVSGAGQPYAAQNQPPYYQAPAAAAATYGSQPYPAAGSQPYPGRVLKGSGVGIRFLATLLDGIIMSIVMGVFMGGMLASQASQMAYTGTIDYGMYVIPTIIGLAYFILMEGLVGGTVGKLACGLRVVTKNGEKCGIGKSVIRNLMRIVDGFFGYLVGAICVWVSADNQRLGDMVAGTLVVKKQDLMG